ncbi:hypothetical protein DSO57_1029806 [Entomophthora muscae]|uniref:Uncharacterized protein n=2 Tax=Entomophthora muscae TaxID=34485 RepID=A0ACC2TZM6_9FUNG|nr:hypothetical protein DSO57_1026020 [Entomophthora muscae]KAJ9079985.1 hypothetical protein DSO57_1029806 [Entomophthora muscae]
MIFYTKDALAQISPFLYRCPCCQGKEKVGIFRAEKALNFLFIPVWKWSEGDSPFFKCSSCEWSGAELKLTLDQLIERDRKMCGGCGTEYEKEDFRFCPYCGCQRVSH